MMKVALLGAAVATGVGSLGFSQLAGIVCLPGTAVAALHATRKIREIAKQQLQFTPVPQERYLERERSCTQSERQWMGLELQRLEWVNLRNRAGGNAKGCLRLCIPLFGIFVAWGYRGPGNALAHRENQKAIAALRAIVA